MLLNDTCTLLDCWLESSTPLTLERSLGLIIGVTLPLLVCLVYIFVVQNMCILVQNAEAF